MRAAILLCLVSLAAAAQTSMSYLDYAPRTNDETEIVRAENEWCDAAIHRDKSRLADVFADDLIYMTTKGSRNKAQAIDDYLTHIQVIKLRLTEVSIRAYGDSAVVTGHVHVRYKSNGKVVAEINPSTDVFVKRDGHWRLVST